MTGLNPMSSKKLIDDTILTTEEQEWVVLKAEDVAERFGINPDEKSDKIRGSIREEVLNALEQELENGNVFSEDTLDEEKIEAIVDGVTNVAEALKNRELKDIEDSVELEKAETGIEDKMKFAYGMKMVEKSPKDVPLYQKDEAEEKAVRLRTSMHENPHQKMRSSSLAQMIDADKKNVRETVGMMDALQSEIDQLAKEILRLKDKMSEVEKTINKIADLELIEQEEATAKTGFFASIKKWYRSRRKVSSDKWSAKSTEEIFSEQLELQQVMIQAIIDLNKFVESHGSIGDEIDDDVEEINEVHNGTLEFADLVDRQNTLRLRFAKLVQGAESVSRLKNQQREELRQKLEDIKKELAGNEAEKKSIDAALDKETMQLPAERRRIFYSRFGEKIAYIRSKRASLHKVAAYGESRRMSHIETIARLYFELRADVLKFERITGLNGRNGFVEILDSELGSIELTRSLSNPDARTAIDDLEQSQRAIAAEKRQREIKARRLVEARKRIDEAKSADRAGIAQLRLETLANNGAVDIVPEPPVQPEPLANQPQIEVEVGGADEEPEPVSAPPIEDEPEVVLTAEHDPSRFIGVDFNVPADFSETRYTFAIGDNAKKTADALGIQPQIDVTFGGFEGFSYQGFGGFRGINPLPVQPKIDVEVGAANDVDEEEPPTTRKSTEKKESDESKEKLRQSETLYIGDLNGSYDAFVKNMTALKAMRIENPAPGVEKVIWTAGDRKVILLGDYLADRSPEGFKIALAIADLMDQAREQGGVIQLMYGNHEDWMVRFLLDIELLGTPGGTNRFAMFKNALQNSNQAYGLLEPLKKFTTRGETFSGTMDEFKNDLNKSLPLDATSFSQINLLVDEAMANMRKPENKEGRKILEQLCQMKLVAIDDTCLVLHTDLTTDILNDLIGSSGGPKNINELKETIKSLNGEFRELLRALLFDEPPLDQDIKAEKMSALRKLAETYASTNNRDFDKAKPENALLLKKLADIGIKSVVHGHSFNEGSPVTTTDAGIQLVNLDFGLGHPVHGVADDVRSVAYFGRDRVFRLGVADMKDLDEHPYNHKIITKLVSWLDDIFSLTDKPKYKVAMKLADDMVKDRDGNPRNAEEIERVVDNLISDVEMSKIMWTLAKEKFEGKDHKARPYLSLNFDEIRKAYYAADYLLDKRPSLSVDQVYEVMTNVDFISADFEKKADKYIEKRRAEARIAREEKRRAAGPEEKAKAEPAVEPPKKDPEVKPDPVVEPPKKGPDLAPDGDDTVHKSLKKMPKHSALIEAAITRYSKDKPAEYKLLVENMKRFEAVFDFIFAGEFDGVKFATNKMKPVKIGENGTAPEMILANLLKYGLDETKLATKQTELEELKMAAGGTLTPSAIQKYLKDIYAGSIISFARDKK